MLACLPTALCAAPLVEAIEPRGLQIGATTVIVVRGSDLLPEPRIESSLAIAKQVVLRGATAQRAEIAITLADDVAAGIYPLWIYTSKGVSSAIAVGVDALPQQAWGNEIESLPVALSGEISGSAVLQTKLAGKQGQRLVVDVEARRLGSALKPVVRLYGERGAQLAWSPPHHALAGDARFETTLPSDGSYTLELHDKLYRAASGSAFRLKVGTLHYADMVFPLAVQRGAAATVRFAASNVPGEFTVSTASADPLAGYQSVATGSVAGFSGSQPGIMLSDHDELVESPAAKGGKLQSLPAAPVAVNGCIAQSGEEDRYLLAVEPGAKLRFDLWAARAGSPLDGVLSIRRENGQQIAQNDDRRGTADPGVDITVPQGVGKLVVAVRDLSGAGGDDFVYRIAASDATAPDFALSISDDQINVGAKAKQVVEVRAQRTGYKGPIELAVRGLPDGITAAPAEIAAGETIGLVTLTASSGRPACARVAIVGSGQVDGRSLLRAARLPESSVSQMQPWLREQFAVALARPAPVNIAWTDSSDEQKLLLGGRLPVSISLKRGKNVKGKVRLRLVTSQVIPQKTVQQGRRKITSDDLTRALRFEKAVELADGADAAEAQILIPADLPEKTWDLAIVAELLAADNKTVRATSSTTVRRLAAMRALQLELAGEKKIEARAGDGTTGKFSGKVMRAAGLAAPVTVTLTGLPEGYTAPKTVIPADEDRFELEVRFPAEAAAAELKSVKLVGSIEQEEGDPKSRVSSKAVPVTVKVVAGDSPSSE